MIFLIKIINKVMTKGGRPGHAGANPSESISKILIFLTIMDPNFLIKINLEGF